MPYLDTNGLTYLWAKIKALLAGKADKSHTHSYAGAGAAGGSANSAVKLDSSAGSGTQPVYFSGGKPVATSYTLGKSVPSDAKFTDTVYTHPSSHPASMITGLTKSSVGLDKVDNTADSEKSVKYATSAGSATKLATPRSINVGTGATGTATNFDGSGGITIPVTGFYESYATWGGKHIAGEFGPFDAALNPALGANRLAGIKAAGVTVEYSTDGGATWKDYGLTDESKRALFTTSTTVYIAKGVAAGSVTANHQVRITIDGIDGGIYTALYKFQLHISTNGSTGSSVTIDRSTYSEPETFTNLIKEQSIGGWSGWNVLNFSSIGGSGSFGGTNNPSHIRKLRFTFKHTGCASAYTGLQIMKIYAYGGVGWITPSTLAARGVPYTYDNNGAATFADGLYAPTKAAGTNDTSAATTAFVQTAINGAKYTHPTSAGNKHIPAGGASGQILRWSADGTATWGADNNTTYSNMTAATASAAGKAGLVPAPAAGAQAKYLRGDGTWQTPPDTNTTYSAATQSAQGLMSAADKTKLDGIATGANKTTVDSALSSTSTNPVQNKVVNLALEGKLGTSAKAADSGKINGVALQVAWDAATATLAFTV